MQTLDRSDVGRLRSVVAVCSCCEFRRDTRTEREPQEDDAPRLERGEVLHTHTRVSLADGAHTHTGSIRVQHNTLC